MQANTRLTGCSQSIAQLSSQPAGVAPLLYLPALKAAAYAVEFRKCQLPEFDWLQA
jgi:hypothetical protein